MILQDGSFTFSSLLPQNRKCAVIIGVNQTGGLPVLSAAVSGAEDFDKWALSQGFETCLLTDKGESVVTVKMIKDAVAGFVNQKVYEQMIVYFSGHGILKSAMDEYWLLSGAPVDSNEAVSVQPSRFLSHRCGIPNVVFISDACRSVPRSFQIAQVSGSVIFPNTFSANTRVNVDMLYATAPGDPAFEVQVQEATNNYCGLYTKELLKGLTGNVPEIIQEYDLATFGAAGFNNRKYSIVPAYELSEYLYTAVPISASLINITLNQSPAAEVTSRPPSYLSLFEGSKREVDHSDAAKIDTDRLEDIDLTDIIIDKSENLQELDPEEFNKGILDDILEPRTQYISPSKNYDKAAFDSILGALNKSSKDIHTGFTIVGIEYVNNQYSNGEVQIFGEKGAVQIRINIGIKTYLLDLPGGRLLPLAVLPGFMGTVVYSNGEVITVNYSPSKFGIKPISGFNKINNKLEERRAVIAAKSKGGIFKISENIDELIQTASYLRRYKNLDPSLGLYAAYAYIQAGKFEDVKSIYDYMKREPEPVIFDVAMLNELSTPEPDKDFFDTSAPFCPMLNQGWSYLTVNPDFFDPFLIEISKHRQAGLWTTFTPTGSELIKQKFKI